jgi:hypothetical protein
MRVSMLGRSRPKDSIGDRLVELGPNTPGIPERLLLAHARGEVVFIAGAGVSQPAKMPDFRQLVLDVYEELDRPTYNAMSRIPRGACNLWETDLGSLTPRQAAELRRFIRGDYDVVLGLLERRLDEGSQASSAVRQRVCEVLRDPSKKPAAIHTALLKLADRGGAVTLLTTNFDRLFEQAARQHRKRIRSYSLGGIPRPGRALEFAGILHIHGSVNTASGGAPDLVLSDRDFGEFYLRRRTVPDLIYDLARLFHIVLVGYSANDPPMRYLLNAVAADGSRFDDLKERYTFVGSSIVDPVEIEDWKGRGITPITYASVNGHAQLLDALSTWADLSAINGTKARLDSELRIIVSASRASTTQAVRDKFDHLYRRSSPDERVRLASLITGEHASIDWLNAMNDIDLERTPSA